MKKLILAAIAMCTTQAFAAWNTISYNNNLIAITGANFSPPTGGFNATWTGYIANNRNSSTYHLKIWDLSVPSSAPVVWTSYLAYGSSTTYNYSWNLFPNHYHNCTLYAATNQPNGIANPSTHVTTYSWMSWW